jgi:hypothetical protein
LSQVKVVNDSDLHQERRNKIRQKKCAYAQKNKKQKKGPKTKTQKQNW